jgi:hypothetical protein
MGGVHFEPTSIGRQWEERKKKKKHKMLCSTNRCGRDAAASYAVPDFAFHFSYSLAYSIANFTA